MGKIWQDKHHMIIIPQRCLDPNDIILASDTRKTSNWLEFLKDCSASQISQWDSTCKLYVHCMQWENMLCYMYRLILNVVQQHQTTYYSQKKRKIIVKVHLTSYNWFEYTTYSFCGDILCTFVCEGFRNIPEVTFDYWFCVVLQIK